MLTTLCLENNCVDDAGAEALARVLRPRKDGNTSRLTHLDLTSNEITAEGAQVYIRSELFLLPKFSSALSLLSTIISEVSVMENFHMVHNSLLHGDQLCNSSY